MTVQQHFDSAQDKQRNPRYSKEEFAIDRLIINCDRLHHHYVCQPEKSELAPVAHL
jgi:hypothetical protein